MLRFLHKTEKPRRRICFKNFQGNSLPFFEYFRLNSTVWCPRRGAGDRDPNAVYGAAEIGNNQYFLGRIFVSAHRFPNWNAVAQSHSFRNSFIHASAFLEE